MFIPIVKSNSVEVLDARTRTRKYTIWLSGNVVGTPVIQGDTMSVSIQESNRTVTKIYDLVSGQLKYTI